MTTSLWLSIALTAGFMFPPAAVSPTVQTTRVLGDSTGIELTWPLPAIPDRTSEITRVKTDAPPDITARSAIVVDASSGSVLYEKNPDSVLPIASLSKVLTWVTFEDRRPDWITPVALTESNNRLTGSTLHVETGEHMLLWDLTNAAMVASANNATEAFAESTGLSIEAFVEAMNAKARALGAETFHVVEPTGLSEANVASVKDYWKLLRYARHFPDLKRPLSQNAYEFITKDHAVPRRVTGANHLVGRTDVPLVMGKTGYTEEAGWCYGGVFASDHGDVIVVVLGADTSATRFDETVMLYNYALDQFSWN